MSDLGYGTETAEPAAPGPDAGDDSRHGEGSTAAGHGGDPGAYAADNQLPARQDARTATWDDDLGYDEGGLSGEYDGELEALMSGDQLPSRQDSRTATWDDNPEYASEADLGTEYDGDLDALTAGDYALDHGQGDQGWADEAPEPPSAGSSADINGAGEADPGEPRPDQPTDADTGEAARADDGRARVETALEAELRELKAEYKASIAELKAELQAIRDRQEAAPDMPQGTGAEPDQPRVGRRPVELKDRRVAADKSDRPGSWSNAKTALYGAAGTTVTLAAADQFVPGAPHPVVDLATGALTIIAALVPAMREGWRARHDDSPDKPRH